MGTIKAAWSSDGWTAPQNASASVPDSVNIVSVCRRMRGGAQAFLVRAGDGCTYVAKFAGNPQGNRTLMNEFIGHWVLKRVGVTTPVVRVLRLSERFVELNKLYFELGQRTQLIRPGLHWGSQCPVNPVKEAIFDFLPRRMFQHVSNMGDFGKAFVVDAVLGQTDTRQCIFVRERGLREGKLSLRAYMIDNGMLFDGSRWAFRDPSLRPRPWNAPAYLTIDMKAVCLQAVNALREINEGELQALAREVPGEWCDAGDRDELFRLMGEAARRIQRADSIVWRQLDCLMAELERPYAQSVAAHTGIVM